MMLGTSWRIFNSALRLVQRFVRSRAPYDHTLTPVGSGLYPEQADGEETVPAFPRCLEVGLLDRQADL